MKNSLSNQKNKINVYVALIFIYVVSAIAFESTPETAIISSLAIYAIFIAGIVFILKRGKLTINAYVVSMVAMCTYVYLMTLPPTASQSMGMSIAYKLLTCNILCLVVFWLTLQYKLIISGVIVANIVGSIILTIRIILAYGGIEKVFMIAASSGENRIGGIISNTNSIGLSLATAIIACVFFLVSQKNRKIKIVVFSCLIILTVMLFLTGSRKSVAFAILGTIFFLLLMNRKNSIVKKLAFYVCLISGAIVLLNIMKNVPIFSTVYTRFELLFEGIINNKTTYTTDVLRQYMITTGIEEFWKNPIFGNGTARSYVMFGTYSHNNFIELLMNYGIVGFLIYYLPYVLLLFNLIKRAMKVDVIAIFFLVYILMQIVLSVGLVCYYDRLSQVMIACAWGHLYHQRLMRGVEQNETEKSVQLS